MKTATQAGRGPYATKGQSLIGRMRRAAGMTQFDAARRAGVSLRTFQRAEGGDVCPRNVKRQIERALGAAW